MQAVTQAAWQAEHSSLPTACCSRICLCVCSCSVPSPWESRLQLHPCRARSRLAAQPGRHRAAGGSSPWKRARWSGKPHFQPPQCLPHILPPALRWGYRMPIAGCNFSKLKITQQFSMRGAAAAMQGAVESAAHCQAARHTFSFPNRGCGEAASQLCLHSYRKQDSLSIPSGDALPSSQVICISVLTLHGTTGEEGTGPTLLSWTCSQMKEAREKYTEVQTTQSKGANMHQAGTHVQDRGRASYQQPAPRHTALLQAIFCSQNILILNKRRWGNKLHSLWDQGSPEIC